MPNDNTHTLLPCPFCGADALAGQCRERSFFVQCVSEDCEASVDHFNGPDHAAEAWNTRTPAEPKAGDWEKELEIHTAVEIHDRFQNDGIGDTEYARLDEVRALSSAAPRITEREWISVDELRHVEARLLVLELLRRQGYAKGGYFNTCKSCGKEAWWMDKLAWTCLECAQHNVKDLLYSITNDPSEPPPFTPTQTEE